MLVHRVRVPLSGVSRSDSGVGFSQLQGEDWYPTFVPIGPQGRLLVDCRILPQPDDQTLHRADTTFNICDKCVHLIRLRNRDLNRESTSKMTIEQLAGWISSNRPNLFWPNSKKRSKLFKRSKKEFVRFGRQKSRSDAIRRYLFGG